MLRFSGRTSAGVSAPTSLPRRRLGTAVSLSTIIHLGARSPFRALGWSGSLKIGAGVGSVVSGHTTIESFASNRSSWTITAGRGLPTYAAPPATVQISPRFIPHPRPRSRPRTPGPPSREHFWPLPPTDDGRGEGRLSIAHRGPRSERDEAPSCGAGYGARGPCHETSSECWRPWRDPPVTCNVTRERRPCLDLADLGWADF